ncbi:MAG: hypothetical protein AAF253_05535, partial [Pseudomonadota bacterium]
MNGCSFPHLMLSARRCLAAFVASLWALPFSLQAAAIPLSASMEIQTVANVDTGWQTGALANTSAAAIPICTSVTAQASH